MTNTEIIQAIKAEIEKEYNESHNKKILAHRDKDYYNETAYGAVMGACNRFLSFLSTLESEKPMNPDDAMKELNEKIALVKQRGTWDGVDVDKYMDEVRGREPEKPMNQEGLDEEIESYWKENGPMSHAQYDRLAKCASHFAKWGAEHFRDSTKMMEIPNDLEEAAKHHSEQYRPHWPNQVRPTYDALIAGAKWDREQMMKEAVEHYVVGEIAGSPVGPAIVHYDDNLIIGSEVRVIVLKKED